MFLNDKVSWKKIIICTILLSILANYKFTFFLLNLGAIGIVSIYLLVNTKIGLFTKIILALIIENLLIWIIIGQKIENFISYIITYFNMSATYYQYAMDIENMKHGYWYIGIAIIISMFLLYKFLQTIITSKKTNKKE